MEGLQLLHDTMEANHSSTKDAHVRKIVEIPNMKDGSGKELRRLHDTALQHLRVLRAIGHDPACWIIHHIDDRHEYWNNIYLPAMSAVTADIIDYSNLFYGIIHTQLVNNAREGCSKKLVEGLQLLHDTTEAKHSSTKDVV